MKQALVAMSALILLGATYASPKNPPKLLTGAVHCLADKSFLETAPAASRTFGYFLDEKSYPGQRVMYVVNYSVPVRSNGWVFVIFVTEDAGHQHFNIQNNARFVLAKHNFDYDGVKFLSLPLGGDWRQQHIAMAIKRIERGARFTLNGKLLSVADGSTCEAYTDPQGSHP